MRKFIVAFPTLLLMLALLGVSGCGEKTTADLAGVQDLLTLIPEKATGIFAMNLQRITQLDIFKEQMEKVKTGQMETEKESFKDYLEFIDQTGIDPEKDLKTMVVAMFDSLDMRGDVGKDFAAVIALNYDKEKILNFIREKGEKYETEEYQGQMLYKIKSRKGEDITLSFFNTKVIVLGNQKNIESIIDLEQKGGKNILDNSRLKPFLGQLKANTLMSFVFDFPENLKEAQPQGAPFKMDLSKAEILHGFINYENLAWSGEIKLISKDEESNKQIVNLLNGLKGMAVLAGPEVAELVSNINLTSSADNIKLTFSISDELVKKLQKKVKEKSSGFMQPTETE
ncbi:MAG: hypothetical protein KAT17_07500 [Candidatus Aminicenantes bacterium]|nr:hypothetical protein [Candidatus Aminicenantes bacterium]